MCTLWRTHVHPLLLTQDIIDLQLDLGQASVQTVRPLHPESNSHQLVICPFCKLGPASASHWLIWCPIVGVVLTKSIGKVYDVSIFTSPDTPSSTLTTLIKAVANLRRHLLSIGCLTLDVATQPFSDLAAAARQWHGSGSASTALKHLQHLDSSINHLGAITRKATFTTCFPGLEDACPALSAALFRPARPSLLAAVPTANFFKTCPAPVLSQDVPAQTLLAVLPHQHPTLSLVSSSRTFDRPRCLVELVSKACSCGLEHVHVISLEPAIEGSELICAHSAPPNTLSYILVQSDGSFVKNRHGVYGGLGIVVWACSFHKPPTALAFRSVPAPSATDSTHAEALAFSEAVNLAIDFLPASQSHVAPAMPVVFQMDNLPLVQHANKRAKCSHGLAARIMARSLLLLFCTTKYATVEYVPRESNGFADHAAGLASSHLLSIGGTAPCVETLAFENDLALPSFGTETSALCVPESGPMRLVECPSVSLHETIAFISHFGFAKNTHRIAAQQYARLFSTGSVATLTVPYKQVSGQRTYSPPGSGQALPKDVRLFFFGKDHFEVDMVAAQLHLLIAVSTGSPLIGSLSVAEFRIKLTEDLARLNQRHFPQEFVKKFLNVALNVTYEVALRYLQSQFLFIPEYLVSFLNTLQEHKTRAITFAISKGFDPAGTTHKNLTYFALEYLEQFFMRAFLCSICTSQHIESIIYIHDGIYVRPCPDDYVLQVAVCTACRKLGVPTVNIKVTNLLTSWRLKFGSLVSQLQESTWPMPQSKRTKFEVTYTTTHNTSQKRKSLTFTSIEDANTLHRFFKKKKLID